MLAKDIDRLAKFAEMMLGELKSARASARAANAIRGLTTESERYKIAEEQFGRSIEIGEAALAPFRSELGAVEPKYRPAV